MRGLKLETGEQENITSVQPDEADGNRGLMVVMGHLADPPAFPHSRLCTSVLWIRGVLHLPTARVSDSVAALMMM
jgi:hypothetical protein